MYNKFTRRRLASAASCSMTSRHDRLGQQSTLPSPVMIAYITDFSPCYLGRPLSFSRRTRTTHLSRRPPARAHMLALQT